MSVASDTATIGSSDELRILFSAVFDYDVVPAPSDSVSAKDLDAQHASLIARRDLWLRLREKRNSKEAVAERREEDEAREKRDKALKEWTNNIQSLADNMEVRSGITAPVRYTLSPATTFTGGRKA